MGSGLLVVGLTTLDIAAKAVDCLTHTERATIIEGITCVPAGTAGGTAMVAARLGVPVRIAGAIGNDMTGAFVRMGFEIAGVDTGLLVTLLDQRTSSTLLTIETNGQRSSYHSPGAGSALPIGDEIITAACQARFVHYGAIGGTAGEIGRSCELLRAAKQNGATVTCDLVTPRGNAPEHVKRILPNVDYFMPSAAEARALSGTESLDEAAEYFISLGARACIIKDGEKGSHIFIDGQHCKLPAYPIQIVDTTSCGDSYCAGFIAGLLHGWTPIEACRLATMTAALVAQGLGTLGKLQDFDSTVEALRTTSLQRCDR
jgi:sugar/nucleoside kinase (ribokinase family)